MANRILATANLFEQLSHINKKYCEYLTTNNQPDSKRFFGKSINDFEKNAISYSNQKKVSLAIKKQNWEFYTNEFPD